MIIPQDVERIIDRHSGKAAGKIKREIEKVVVDLPNTIKMAAELSPAQEDGRTVGNWILDIKGNELRPETDLTWEIIDAMEESAMPSFAVLMKLAPILSVFRSWQGILVKSSNDDLNEVVMENTRQILPLMAMEFGFRSMIDGVCFMETRWGNTTKFQMGIAKNRLPSKLYTVGKHPHIVDPRSVKSIIRNGARREFGGFIQRNYYPPNNDIPVPASQALVIPHNEKFRNLWGNSALEPLYRPWFWYQVLLRSAVRWGERMAIPLIIAKGPMQEKLEDPADPTNSILAMDYMRNIASTLSRSTFGVIPSDMYPETNTPKYEVGYESVSDSGVSSALSALIQEFAQMIIRAAISADRATTQASGGVGSYAIGSIHDQATQYHNQLILTRWINYLNRFYMPWYSYYNLGVNGPPIRLEVATVDPSFRDLLNQMLGTMGNTKPGQEALWSIDYDTFLSLAHIPTLDPEEAQRRKDKYEQEALDRAEEAMKRQQAAAPPPEAAQARREQSSSEPKTDAANKADQTIKNIVEAREEIMARLERGQKIPIIAGAKQIEDWQAEERKPIVLQDPDFDESRVNRDAGGRFASKSSASGKEGPEFIGDKDNAKALLSQYGLTPEQVAEAEAIIDASKSYDSIEAAVDDIVSFLVENGFGDESDIRQASRVVFDDLSRGVGYYDYAGDKSIGIEEGLKQAVLSGNPMGINALMHEILHASSQSSNRGAAAPQNEFQQNALDAGYPTRANNMDELSQAVPIIEGRNELANLIAMNKFYGTDGKTLNDPAYKAAIHSLYGDVKNYKPDQDSQPYSSDIEVFAQVALAAEKSGAGTASEWATESNKMGLNTIAAEDELRIIFQDRMDNYGTQEDGSWRFPTAEEVSTWAEEDYGIPRDGALDEVLGGQTKNKTGDGS